MKILNKIRDKFEKLAPLFYLIWGRDYQCRCGHTAKWKTIMTVDGRGGIYTLPVKNPDFCPQCWKNAAIECAWCKSIILPGDAVTLLTPTAPDFVIPNHATIYNEDPLQLVGCLRWDCEGDGTDRAGFWLMPGQVERVMTPMETLMANNNEGCVIINDLSDRSQNAHNTEATGYDTTSH